MSQDNLALLDTNGEGLKLSAAKSASENSAGAQAIACKELFSEVLEKSIFDENRYLAWSDTLRGIREHPRSVLFQEDARGCC